MTTLESLLEALRGGRGGADRMAVTDFARELKKHLRKKWGFAVRVNTSGTKSDDPYMKVSPVKWQEDKIPNDFRLKAVKVLGGKPLNPENVSYGNVQPHYVTLNYSEWLELIGPLKSTKGPKRPPRKKKPAPTGEDRYKAFKRIVDRHQNEVIPGIGRVDATTANVIVRIADGLSPTNRKKFLSMDWDKMHAVAMRMM